MGKMIKENGRLIVEIIILITVIIGMAVGYGTNKNQTEVNRLTIESTNEHVDNMCEKIEKVLIKQAVAEDKMEHLKTQNSLILKHVVK